MKKVIVLLAFTGAILNASTSFAYWTAFTSASATWWGFDADGDVIAGYATSWDEPDSYVSCGTNCRRYNVISLLGIYPNTGTPVWKLRRTGAVMSPTSEYYSSDWDYRNISGNWGAEDFSTNYETSEGDLIYHSYRYYNDPCLSSSFNYEIDFEFSYTPSISGERQVNFYYTAMI